jgi:hypothetical protein
MKYRAQFHIRDYFTLDESLVIFFSNDESIQDSQFKTIGIHCKLTTFEWLDQLSYFNTPVEVLRAHFLRIDTLDTIVYKK